MKIPTPIPFEDLLSLACKGSEAAARELYQRCRGDLLKAIRHQLRKGKQVRDGYDSDDFVQSVWGTFLRQPDRREFNSPEELIAFLRRVARNKVKTAIRRVHGQGERPRDREPLDGREADLPQDDPTPSQEMIAEEAFDNFVAGETEILQRILTLLRKGFRQREIARILGVSDARIAEVLQRFKARRARQDPEGGGEDDA